MHMICLQVCKEASKRNLFLCISKDEGCRWAVIPSQLMGSDFPCLPTSASLTHLITLQSPSPATALTGCGQLLHLLKETSSYKSGRKWVTSPGGLTPLPVRNCSRFIFPLTFLHAKCLRHCPLDFLFLRLPPSEFILLLERRLGASSLEREFMRRSCLCAPEVAMETAWEKGSKILPKAQSANARPHLPAPV